MRTSRGCYFVACVIGMLATLPSLGTCADELSLTIHLHANPDQPVAASAVYPFSVEFQNAATTPVHVWSQTFREHGHGLQLIFDDGLKRWIVRPAKPLEGVKTHQLKFSDEFAPGESNVSGAWVECNWLGAPLLRDGQKYRVHAVYRSVADPEAEQFGVWTGRIESPAVEVTHKVGPKWTPHEYLFYGYPEKAFEMVRANPEWITKEAADLDTLLHLACRYNEIEFARWLLDHGADVNDVGGNDFTPLHFAQSAEMAQLLIERGVDVDAVNIAGTALRESTLQYWHWRFHLRDEEAALKYYLLSRELIDAGAKYTAIEAACLGDFRKVASEAANRTREERAVLLQIACEGGYRQIVKYLLDFDDTPPRIADAVLAVDHPEALRVFHEKGLDLSQRFTDDRRFGVTYPEITLLHAACENGSLPSIRLLLGLGSNINARTSTGMTPLHIAVESGRPDVVVMLLASGADPHAKTDSDLSVAELAASKFVPGEPEKNAAYADVIRMLQDVGCVISLIPAIAIRDHTQILASLTKDPEQSSQAQLSGYSPLHFAIITEDATAIRLLLAHGADPEIAGEHQSSPKEFLKIYATHPALRDIFDNAKQE